MSDTTTAILLGIFTLASSVWIGGYVSLVVVARVASSTLALDQRVAFFRTLGRRYLLVGGPCLIIALGTGAGLLHGHPWDASLILTVVAAALLIVALLAGIAQARHMTRLRAAMVAQPTDPALRARVKRGARTAGLLRGGLGLLTLCLISLGTLLAT